MWEFTEMKRGKIILIIEFHCLFSLKQLLNSLHVFIINTWQHSINKRG